MDSIVVLFREDGLNLVMDLSPARVHSEDLCARRLANVRVHLGFQTDG